MSKVKISKLCIEIDGKKIELTMKQAKELSEVLNDTFGGPEVVFRDRWYSTYPYIAPYQPYYSTCGTITTSTGPAMSAYSTATAVVDGATWQGQIDAGMITLTSQ